VLFSRPWPITPGSNGLKPRGTPPSVAPRSRRFPKTFPNGFDLTLRPELIDLPKHWRRPRVVFVNSMSDLFHADVPEAFITQVFGVMAECPQHTFQVLTKRAERLARMAQRLPWPALMLLVILGNSPVVDYEGPSGVGTPSVTHYLGRP